MTNPTDVFYSERYDLPDLETSPTVLFIGDIRYRPQGTGMALSHILPHSHVHYEFMLVVEGAVMCTVDGTAQAIRAGDLCVFKPGQTHSMESVATSDVCMVYIGIDRIEPQDLADALSRLSRPMIPDCAAFVEQLMAIMQEARDSRYGAIDVVRLLTNVWLYQVARRISGTAPRTNTGRFSEPIRAAIAHIEAHARHGMVIAEIASEIGLSESRLKHKFTEEVHMPLGHYIRQVVMQRALRLLETGDMNVSEIADHLGFPSLQYFSQAFRRHWGTPPAQVRSRRR